MTLDPATGEFWIGDVGQYHREEINLLSRGANYQWPFLEGDRPTPKPRPLTLAGTETPPLYQYPRQEGGCIIGGFVYRGSLHPDLVGSYLYADWTLGAVRSLVRDRENRWVSKHLITLPRHGTPPRNGISGLGTNEGGEIFVISLDGTNLAGGRIYRLFRESAAGREPPALLSQTGAFTDLETLEPTPGLIPYEPIQPLWSDGAGKRRWMAIPNDGNPNSAPEQILFSENGEWIFPVGTVLVKHFELGAKRLETRFLVRGGDGDWFGFTYRWNEDQLDAVLLSGEAAVTSDENLGEHPVEWRFPSRSECFLCHTEASGRVLGIKTRHLNSPILYPSSGRTANQVSTLNRLGFLRPRIDESLLTNTLRSANLHDESATLERRARSYLDVNCSHCHRPGGTTPAAFDARLTVAPFFQNLISVSPLNPLGISGAALVKPGDPASSILSHRLAASDGDLAMPPLGRSLPDEEAIGLIDRWIRSLDPTTGPSGPVTATVTGPPDHRPPTGALTSPSGSVIYGPAQIRLEFTEAVTGLSENDFEVSNGTVSHLSGSGGGHTFRLTPETAGPLSVSMTADRFTDLNGNANPAVPGLSLEYREPVVTDGWRFDYYESDFIRLPTSRPSSRWNRESPLRSISPPAGATIVLPSASMGTSVSTRRANTNSPLNPTKGAGSGSTGPS